MRPDDDPPDTVPEPPPTSAGLLAEGTTDGGSPAAVPVPPPFSGAPAAPTTIVFSHANGFGASTYRVLFDGWRAAGHRVLAVERFGHDPDYPVSSNWPHLLRQLVRFIEDEAVPSRDGRVVVVGHSLGGYLSLMAAATRPDLVRGLLMLDSPVLAGWRAHSVHMAKVSGLVRRVSPGRISRKRRHQWPDVDAVRRHFAEKPAFARWDPRVLEDYAVHGTVDRDGTRELAFDRDVETRIYDTLPHHFDRLLRRHPLRCPAAFVGGTRSQEIHQVGLAATRRLCHDRLSWIAGTHLFPFERPDETIQHVGRWLAELDALEAADATPS